jgi:hypothetical protein
MVILMGIEAVFRMDEVTALTQAMKKGCVVETKCHAAILKVCYTRVIFKACVSINNDSSASSCCSSPPLVFLPQCLLESLQR